MAILRGMKFVPRIPAAAALLLAVCAGMSCDRQARSGEQPVNAKGTTESFSSAGDLAMARGHHEEALAAYQKGLALADKEKDPLQWIDLAVNTVVVLWLQNQEAEAEALYKEIRRLPKQHSTGVPPETASRLKSLGTLLDSDPFIPDREPEMRRALAESEKKFGKDQPGTVNDVKNLARRLESNKRRAEAERLWRRALAIDEASLGKSHREVAEDLKYLAFLLRKSNRVDETEPLLRRALEIDETTYGKDSIQVADDLHALFLCLRATKRPAEAEAPLRRALAIFEATYEKDSPKTGSLLSQLANLLQDMHRPKEAEPLLRRALEIAVTYESSSGKPATNLRGKMENYRLLLMEIGHTADEAEEKVDKITGRAHSPEGAGSR